MSFLKELQATLDNEFNLAVTENGALGYRTSTHPLLDMNFKVSSYRNKSDAEIENDFAIAFVADPVLAIKWAFFARDIRGGLGERRLFRVIMNFLARQKPEIVLYLLNLFAEYGRYDDLFALMGTDIEVPVIEHLAFILLEDIKNYQEGKPITLLAKWMPSINTSSAKTRALAAKFVKYMDISERQYRKTLSALRSHINIVEKQISTKQWDKIDYSAVPSQANLKYKNAFLRNDETRRREFLAALTKGEVSINAATLFPHDIVAKYNMYPMQLDETLEGLWKGLPDYVQGDNEVIVVADGSGSMTTRIDLKGTTTALDVANALAIYFAERASGEFHNKFITFSARPQLVDFGGTRTLGAKLEYARRFNEVANTNIEAVFELLLKTIRRSPLTKMPKNILIISDMEFDGATTARVDERLMDSISRRFAEAGVEMPRLVFWNVNSRTNVIPMKENDAGVALVSGFSPAICKMVLSSELDPFKVLVEALSDERYDAVEKALSFIQIK